MDLQVVVNNFPFLTLSSFGIGALAGGMSVFVLAMVRVYTEFYHSCLAVLISLATLGRRSASEFFVGVPSSGAAAVRHPESCSQISLEYGVAL
jgi:hypothetical protein